MNNTINIWYDVEAHNGRGTPTEYSELAEIMPTIAIEPCVNCSLYASCATNNTDCKAFRSYAATGRFKNSNINRLMRAIK